MQDENVGHLNNSDDSIIFETAHTHVLEDTPQKPQSRRKRTPITRSRSAIEIERFTEDETDEDFSDILGDDEDSLVKLDNDEGPDRSTLMLHTKLSSNSWLGDVDDEDDPFAQLEEGLDEMDLEANIARDKYARLRSQVEGLVSSLKTSQDDEVLADISEQLVCNHLSHRAKLEAG